MENVNGVFRVRAESLTDLVCEDENSPFGTFHIDIGNATFFRGKDNIQPEEAEAFILDRVSAGDEFRVRVIGAIVTTNLLVHEDVAPEDLSETANEERRRATGELDFCLRRSLRHHRDDDDKDYQFKSDIDPEDVTSGWHKVLIARYVVLSKRSKSSPA